ncbi:MULTISPECIES: hypothetical protein [Klebsiella]|uniref:hypothetical protein n=1 Tax=Klebsiella TaxID=570 RepID=UPI00210DC698|nr:MULTISPECIES: hypothetical protein [Klebsiella]MCQ3906625.1 hypothetical protein [Klebsiella quasipneumoniae]MDD9616376.1 hypothetical protein [Klebsiella quasipneumoniae]MDD9621684.1 hypothetical protein [Klebsiella quasipneumoniae]MDD9626830.1 hypothetical protein [Klebsiella quasipneumoniae]MDI3435925.1 hypothetical protein [Klebsiella sp. V115_8]
MKSQSTFIAITPFRHTDKLTIYKCKKQWKTTQNPDHFVILLFKMNNIFILKLYLSNSYK